MIELQNIASYDGNYTRKYKTDQNSKNDSLEFQKLVNGEHQEDSDTPHITVKENEEIQGVSIRSNTELLTYDFTGRIIKIELFSGVKVDAVV